MITYTKKFILCWLSKWTLASTLTGLFLVCLLPPLYGWLTGNVIGGLFASLLAKHSALLWLTQQALGAGYTLLALSGFNFLFLLMTYTAVNTVFERNQTRKEIAGVAWRALKGLLCWQVIICAAFLVLFGKRAGVYVYSLVPPFLTQSGIASLYMMLWELSLVLFALGYALMKDGVKACLAGGMLCFTNFMVLFVAFGACMAITWLPGLCLSFLHIPTWILVLIGVTLHTVLLNGLLYVLLQQDNIKELFIQNATK